MERAIRVGGSIVKVSESRSKESRHLTPPPSPPSLPVCFPTVHPFLPISPPPSVSSTHSAHTWRESDFAVAQILLYSYIVIIPEVFYSFFKIHFSIYFDKGHYRISVKSEKNDAVVCDVTECINAFLSLIYCYFLKSSKSLWWSL